MQIKLINSQQVFETQKSSVNLFKFLFFQRLGFKRLKSERKKLIHKLQMQLFLQSHNSTLQLWKASSQKKVSKLKVFFQVSKFSFKLKTSANSFNCESMCSRSKFSSLRYYKKASFWMVFDHLRLPFSSQYLKK